MQSLIGTDINHQTASGAGSYSHPHEGASICFYCNRRLGATNDRVLFHLQMLFYVTIQTLYVVIEEITTLIKQSGKLPSISLNSQAIKHSRNQANHRHVQGQLCAHCVTAKQRNRFPVFDMVSEYIYMFVQVLSLCAMVAGGLVFGLASLCMSLFPGSGRHENQAQAEYETRKLAQDLRRQEEEDAYLARRDAVRSAEAEGFNASHPLDVNHLDLMEDDQRVSALNSSRKAIEENNGTESVEDYLKRQDEHNKTRKKLLNNDRQRAHAYSKYIRKRQEADDLRARGNLESQQGRSEAARDFYRREDIAREESSVLYLDYRLI